MHIVPRRHETGQWRRIARPGAARPTPGRAAGIQKTAPAVVIRSQQSIPSMTIPRIDLSKEETT
jgi:hypothetical protein